MVARAGHRAGVRGVRRAFGWDALLVFLVKSAILSAVPEMARDMMASQIHIGLGVWLLLLAGAGLIAAGLGFIRNPLAKS